MKPSPSLTRKSSRRIPRPWAVVAALAMLGAVVIPWLHWTHSGQASRSSYEAFRSAQRLGLDQLDPVRVLWFVLPAVALSAVLAWLAGWVRLSGLLCVSVGIVLFLTGMTFVMSTAGPAVGSWLGMVNGGVAIVAGGYLMWKPQDTVGS